MSQSLGTGTVAAGFAVWYNCYYGNALSQNLPYILARGGDAGRSWVLTTQYATSVEPTGGEPPARWVYHMLVDNTGSDEGVKFDFMFADLG
jgi:hypothetical protein